MPPSQAPSDTRAMGKGMLIVFWLLVIGLLTWGFGNWEESQINPNTSPNSSINAQYREVVLDSNRQHHYVASGLINQQPVVFLLDTGATDVVIPQRLANKLGLKAGNPQIASTANGNVTVYSTRLDNVALGDIHLTDVRASINPGMRGNEVLLGMSALKSIEFRQSQGQLVLRQAVWPE
ncbi:TIGR02281 family clan AA aspartic protease [Aestuariicella hydrocarbonica]|uniref:TIGR02281 family clan AA aspartic protease n=1 Tax=Pseudomaricurvus hydrocarbonicus TaxID=1470433 RepID=A0A9E5JQZ4_9GAMM|nr:TIGR02281 family clan AA aspartic protease [Aestuariicella hydrocarbonica]NHO65112.1 TIGR02281 family clan AA aspartic protease [Aestuariicella hydrocarbonica]